MSRTIILADALGEGIIHKRDYFLVTVPKDRKVVVTKRETGIVDNQVFKLTSGTEQLWRLEDGLKMWGEPTKESLTLKGKTGFDHGINTIHRVAKGLYELPGVFNKCKSCDLPRKRYDGEFNDIWEMIQGAREKYKIDNIRKTCWLASRCSCLGPKYENYNMFYISNGYIGTNTLYRSSGDQWNNSNAVRPVIVPQYTLLLDIDGCSGTKNKPWRCLIK